MKLITFALAVLLSTVGFSQSEPIKALYLTDFSNFYHDYKKSVDEFVPKLQEELNLEVVVVGRNQGDLTTTLNNPNFGSGYDLIIYNACLADTRDYVMARNLIDQTAVKGIPMALLHCAMHNFRGSSSELGWVGRNKLKADQEQWAKDRPNQEFPIWWEFSGVDSTSHALAGRLATKLEASHPITKFFPTNWESRKDELYLNKAVAETVTPLISSKDGKHLVAWLNQAGAGKVFATTLGHDQNTQDDPDFIRLVARGMAYITGNLDANGELRSVAQGNKVAYNYSKSIKCLPQQIFTPSTIVEVQEIVSQAASNSTPLKVISLDNPNSYSDVICSRPGGTLLNLRNFNNIVEILPQQLLVRVQPGVTVDQLNLDLKDSGLVLPTTADYSGITVAGGLGTGAHNSSLSLPSGIHDFVEELKIVDGLGNLVTIKGEEAKKIAVHLGYLGAIVEVTLAVKPLSKLQYGFDIGNDENLEDKIIAMVKSKAYAKVSWFAGVGRYVLDYYDEVPVETPGNSYHNLWSSSAGPISVVGNIAYDALNRLPKAVQCTAANLRSSVWTSPIAAVDSPGNNPVGFTGQMLGSTCDKGQCPWDLGAQSRTLELAIPVSQVPAWMRDVRAILEVNKACFPILGIYMRFATESEAYLATSYGEDVMMFEIHIPKDSTGYSYERGSASYDEIQQMTLFKYDGRPHWGKNSKPIFANALAKYPASGLFQAKKAQLDPLGLFNNEFWDVITTGELPQPFAGCTLERQCICSTDSDCAEGYTCESGLAYSEARICLAK